MERYIKLIDVLIPAKNHNKKQKQGNTFLPKHHTLLPISDVKTEMDKDFKTLFLKKMFSDLKDAFRKSSEFIPRGEAKGQQWASWEDEHTGEKASK